MTSNYCRQYNAGYTVSNFWHPIRRRVTKTSASELVITVSGRHQERKRSIIGLTFNHYPAKYLGEDRQNIVRKIVNIFLTTSLNICFGCSKEPSQWNCSFEHQQHVFWLRNKKKKFNYTFDLDACWRSKYAIFISIFQPKQFNSLHDSIYMMNSWKTMWMPIISH